MLNLKSMPFLKLLMPYVVGILLVLNVGFIKHLHLWFLVLMLLFIVTFVFQKLSKWKNAVKHWLYLVSINLFLIVLAQESCWLYREKNNYEHYSQHATSNQQAIIATIDELPVVNEKFTKLSLSINVIENNNTWHYCQGKTILYLKNSSNKTFEVGTQIFINSSFSFVNAPKNKNEFDYKQFLENKNIYHVLYAKPQQIQIIKRLTTSFSFFKLGTRIKQKVVRMLREANLSQPAFSICCALLVGYDDEIDKDVMQQFAHSGTLHVLSVSGMHTGLLFGLIVWCFAFFDKHDKRRILKCVVVLTALLFFTLITGISPSVLRASIMLSFMVVGQTFYKNGNGFNTLFLSAFVILLFNPILITDVGFLLSYAAVLGIMYFYPLFRQWLVFDNWLIQKAWVIILMSVSATIATLPITLVVFHQFPIWFVVSNVFIIPLSTALMALSAALLILFKITVLKTGIVFIINGITTCMLWIAELTNHSGYGYIDEISFSKFDTLFLTAIIILTIVAFSLKQFKHIALLCMVTIAWLISSIVINYKQWQQTELVVFHVKQKSVWALRNGKTIYMNNSTISNNEYECYIKPYLTSYSTVDQLKTTSQIISLKNTIVLHYNHPDLISQVSQANYIIVSNNTFLNSDEVINHKAHIIADCSNSYTFTKQLKKQCAKAGINFYDVKEQGAFLKVIRDEL